MFMEIAIGAIGIGIVLMVGYIIISQVQSSLPSGGVYAWQDNPCQGHGLDDVTYCNTTSVPGGPLTDNTSNTLYLPNDIDGDLTAVQTTVFAGFGLVAVGIIVLAAFGLINIFK